MRCRSFGATDRGRTRPNNQDAFTVEADLGLAVVADGVGGQARGEVASMLAVRAVAEHIRRERGRLEAFRANPDRAEREAVTDALREAVQMASAQVFRSAEVLGGGRGMSCTLEAVVVLGRTAFLAHVGDSRTFLVRRGGGYQLTEDHSVVMEKVRRGVMTPAQAAKAKGRNVITRAVGAMPSVRVDLMVFQVYAGDRLVLCSDGLPRYVERDELAGLVEPFEPATPERLVQLACERGGKDNVTAVVVGLDAEDEPPEHATTAARLALLRSMPLFETLTYAELAIVGSLLIETHARPGRLLFREGEQGDAMYLLVHGEVVITASGVHLATLKPGACFGEMALLDAPQRSASALVTKPTDLLVLSRYRLQQLVAEHEGLAVQLLWRMLVNMSARVRKGNLA